MNDRYLYKAKKTNNGEWVEGFLKHYPTGEWEIARKCDNPPDCDPMWQRVLITHEVDPSTICQCTGVPDRDKKIMYENDVVRASGGVLGVIRFGRYGDGKTDYGFYVQWEKTHPYWRNDIYYWQSELRVVGSFIDNPELLEVGE